MRRSTRQDYAPDSEGVYESFSDMVLCTLIVLITLVVVLALNAMEQLNVHIERNHFSGGATRPWIYLQAENVDYSQTRSPRLAVERGLFGKGPCVLVNLFSPSRALSTTTVEGGRTVPARKGETFFGQEDLSAYGFLQLAAGIDPGSFSVDGAPTALMLPKFVHKAVVLEEGDSKATVLPDNRVAMNTLALAWPIYGNTLYPRRSQSEYRDARTRIYIESLKSTNGLHQIMIGHSVFTLPRDVRNGRLGWLAGFSSGLTEIVYLGSAWSDPEHKTNKRIAFFEQNGFPEAAADYRAFSYPGKLSAVEQEQLRLAMAARPDVPKERLERYIRDASAQKMVSEAIVEGRDATEFLPPLQAHRDAWKAYIAHCVEEQRHANPPKWLFDELLGPLGFDQAVILEVDEKEAEAR